MVFNSSMFALVNGSPTLDFQVLRGLFQGDSISPFLFLIVVEGIIDMVHNATTLGEFKWFKVNEELHFELLQFADDTVVVCDGSWNNLWSLKAILRGIEFSLGLCVNLNKSNIYGIDMKEIFCMLHPFLILQDLYHSIYVSWDSSGGQPKKKGDLESHIS